MYLSEGNGIYYLQEDQTLHVHFYLLSKLVRCPSTKKDGIFGFVVYRILLYGPSAVLFYRSEGKGNDESIKRDSRQGNVHHIPTEGTIVGLSEM